ncbi:glycosyltransferase family 4 protein [uncultured Methanomethylovorans sp.]|uniref:glycosyltransferase family 4 protein n=1 Tax=uncultured Methanomethylovorans sp. TaxID=183759 RepID=UPI002AA7D3EC|nr:glycosyltransferase family 4 protein [uncultured Methanomethylovorans sp.]
MTDKMKIAFVIPWYGDIPGGAETECRQTAENLQKSGVDVEILTTCVKQFLSDWNADYYKEGIYNENGITVRRFSVRKRDTTKFDQVNFKLMHNCRLAPVEEETFMENMINSDNLYLYITDHANDYDYFFFIPYMFGTTYYGSRIYPYKSILIPCLHDESYAYMDLFKNMFKDVKAVIYNSEPEKELANQIYDIKGHQIVMGAGMDTDISYNPQRFRDKYNIKNNFILYAGRREAGKNVSLLLEYFAKYKGSFGGNLKLVLIGKGELAIPKEYKQDIIDLGFVPLEDKLDAYAAATLFCMPSTNESFSIVMMEAWLCGTPVLVHADCAVTRDHCIKSNGGLYFHDYDEFEECIKYFMKNPEKRDIMAHNGKKYVLNNYSWKIMVEKYKHLLGVI